MAPAKCHLQHHLPFLAALVIKKAAPPLPCWQEATLLMSSRWLSDLK
jgi:hypothetical protein